MLSPNQFSDNKHYAIDKFALFNVELNSVWKCVFEFDAILKAFTN